MILPGHRIGFVTAPHISTQENNCTVPAEIRDGWTWLEVLGVICGTLNKKPMASRNVINTRSLHLRAHKYLEY